MFSRVFVRAAVPSDEPAIARLLAPAIEDGSVLPRHPVFSEFLVAQAADGELVGAVALSAWTDRVVELGALVSARPRQGIGGLLVEAVLHQAARQGFERVVALTALSEWFERRGFHQRPEAPWRLPSAARVDSEDGVSEAVFVKSKRSCAGCVRQPACRQALMERVVSLPRRAVA